MKVGDKARFFSFIKKEFVNCILLTKPKNAISSFVKVKLEDGTIGWKDYHDLENRDRNKK
tara:strand:+ start:1287 stop:1466 length:180 start_codon:yes stop_codon:yes gene_type:complete